MNGRFARPALPALVCFCLLLPACSSISFWPFGGGQGENATRAPPNATEYQCAGSKRFYLRNLDNGSAAWIIFPDREFRLGKVITSAAGARYSNGSATLDVNGNEAMLTDGPAISFTGCRAAGKQ